MLTGADLAYIGDAYYELYIRNYVLMKGFTKPSDLHKETVKYVSRDNQYKISLALASHMNDEEKNIFKRGRNYNYKQKTMEYINASGFEAVIGYLYLLKKEERLEKIINLAIEIIENDW